jgi:hypothetical protein
MKGREERGGRERTSKEEFVTSMSINGIGITTPRELLCVEARERLPYGFLSRFPTRKSPAAYAIAKQKC